ncbi:carbon-nitrogen hydrolase [Chaetomidium leptoderma]|uniref:Carbon-nitrogen hydrolase n=1 Tax=Chaetomidium leptoderma TaxID=669021 RepID=A0AAN6VNG5_9PEZI|nr:carbon-nitrogen hydrolase [Chaetomidium leptoderma]
MRIACLQFDPQVGNVDNNLNLADAVLGKVDPDELDGLDLLVLPELAFTGYNFKSLQHIVPFFEETGSGIASLWAQTTALKHDCAVVVGYPEKVDVSTTRPASLEYYNSAFIVNGDGDTVGNYRKSFLYDTDETWASEGGQGFFKREITGLGNVALGICTDLNPYKLEAAWDAFEFGFHILEAQANLVIMTMAWQDHQNSPFCPDPREPDLETLVYWVQRLEPLIRADKDEEVIVVFCNRTGDEGEATYTGTSAVLGIKRGEVFVYGVLGRGVNDLLVVDTDHPPMFKLTDTDAVEGDNHVVEKTALKTHMDDRQKPEVADEILVDESEACGCHLADSGFEHELDSPRKAPSLRLPWLAQSDQPGLPTTESRSPTRLQIPTRPQFDDYIPMDSAVTDDIIDTPALPATPSFIRRPLRPKLAIPGSPWRGPGKQSPYPWHHHDAPHSAVFGGGAAMTPITPFDEDGWSSTPIDPKAPAPWFWRHEPTLSALKESIVEEEEEEEEEPSQPPQAQSMPSIQEEKRGPSPVEAQEPEGTSEEELEAEPPHNDWADLADVLDGLRARPAAAFDFRASREDRPSSPKSRNMSRNRSPFKRALARPSGREAHGVIQGSSSFDGTNGDSNDNRGRRRLPSQLRHALSFRDNSEDEPDYDSEPDQPPTNHYVDPRTITRGRQPGPRELSPAQQPSPSHHHHHHHHHKHQPPQGPAAVITPNSETAASTTSTTTTTTATTITTTPSLCSATSATSTTRSVSTFGDHHDDDTKLLDTSTGGSSSSVDVCIKGSVIVGSGGGGGGGGGLARPPDYYYCHGMSSLSSSPPGKDLREGEGEGGGVVGWGGGARAGSGSSSSEWV